MKNLLFPLALLGTLGFASCSDKDDNTTTVTPTLETTTAPNVFAGNGQTAANPTTGQPGTITRYTLYSLANKAIVPNADSNTTKWDIGFRSTTIIVNGGTGGPGQGAARVLTGLFDDITTAPADTAYRVDNGTGKAIKTGAGNGWYNYNQATNIISPIAGRVIALRTATGKHAKLEILSYYKDVPATPDATSLSRYFTFRYRYQPDGSKNLK